MSHHYPPQLAPQPADAEDINERLTRIETRLVKLMIHLGLHPEGHQQPRPSAHRAFTNRPFNNTPWTSK